MNIEGCETGPAIYSPYSRRRGKSNHFLLTYFKSVAGPAGVELTISCITN